MTDAPELSAEGRAAIEAVLELLRKDRAAPTSVTDPERAWRVHVADSLAGLTVPALAAAARIADIGAGAGFPGLAIAAARPEARLDLIESVRRRCGFLERAIERSGLANASVVCERAESWGAAEGREACDAVTARALGRLATVAELASPLLRRGGVLVVWKGRRDRGEEAELERAAPRLAVEPLEVRPVEPYPGSRHLHIHLLRKNGPTPEGLPRRAGMAAKRPLGGE